MCGIEVQLLRLLVNILVIMFVVRLLRPLFRSAGKAFKNPSGIKNKKKKSGQKPGETDYSEYTRYEIEDADYEEVGSKRE